jgi:hypothetical protein
MCVHPPDCEQARQRSPGIGKIHDLHLCVDIVMRVSTYISNQLVAEDGCSSIGTIDGLSATNRLTLADEDSFGAVVKVLYSHDRKPRVVEQCACALANLAIELPASKVYSFNTLLSQHRTGLGTALWALIAITRLCKDAAQISRLLAAPAYVAAIMTHFASSAKMMTWALRGTLGLLHPPKNVARFAAASISQSLVHVLSSHNGLDAIVELALVIIAFLSSNDYINSY